MKKQTIDNSISLSKKDIDDSEDSSDSSSSSSSSSASDSESKADSSVQNRSNLYQAPPAKNIKQNANAKKESSSDD